MCRDRTISPWILGEMKPDKVRRRLGKAVGSGRVMQVVRDAFDSEGTEGYVLALTDEWVAMHVLSDGVHLDGVVLMRLRDISSARDGHSDYVDRALASLGTRSAVFTCSAQATARDLVVIAAGLHPLSAFALGDEGVEQLMIGRLLKAGKRRVSHQFIQTDGTWADEVDKWKYDQIASIHIGGRYIDALSTFGDPYPDDAASTRLPACPPG